MESLVPLVLVLILLFLFLLALYWQFHDLKVIDQLPALNTLPPEEQHAQLIFGSCYPYEYAVNWRSLFIAAVVTTLVIWGLDYILKWALPQSAFIFIFVAIVVCTYIVEQWINFHIYRTICLRNTNQPINYGVN